MEEAQGLFADCLQELVDKLGKWPSAKQFAEETGLETDEAKEVLKQCKPLVTGPPKRAKKDHNKVAAENADKTPATSAPAASPPTASPSASPSASPPAPEEQETLPVDGVAADSPAATEVHEKDSDDEPLVDPPRQLKRLKPAPPPAALGLEDPLSPDEESPAEPAPSTAQPAKSVQNTKALEKLDLHKGSSQRSGPQTFFFQLSFLFFSLRTLASVMEGQALLRGKSQVELPPMDLTNGENDQDDTQCLELGRR